MSITKALASPARVGSALALAAAAALLVTAPPALAEPGVIVVTERATTDTITDIGAHGDSAGDLLTFNNEVFDAANATRMGTSTGVCTRTVVGVEWDCGWTLDLPDGQIMVQGPFFDKANSVLAIVGGTGRYADARGDMELTHIAPDDTSFLFTYRVI